MIATPSEYLTAVGCDISHGEALEQIRMFQEFIVEELANPFTIPSRYVVATEAVFATSDTEKTLTLPNVSGNENLVGFPTIYVEVEKGSVNRGHYDIISASLETDPLKIYFEDYETIVAETISDILIYVLPVQFPSILKQGLYSLAKTANIPPGIKSEKLGEWSITYSDILKGSIPPEAERWLAPFRRIHFA